jgi:GT2 family glycosyltransferase
MSASTSGDFRPARVLAVDLARGEVERPDPDVRPQHADARVLVRWLDDPVGMVEVTAPDADVVRAVADRAWQELRLELLAAAARHGCRAPGSAADLPLPAEERPAPAPPVPADAPLVTVTVASYRNVEPTVGCVRRIVATSTWPRLEVAVVDNDADPAPLAAALSTAFSDDERVRWVHEPRQGLSFARNAGLAAARGEVVVFTDDDVLVDRRWVERLVAAFDLPEAPDCVSGAILPAEIETPAQLWLEEYGGFHKGFERKVVNTTTHRPESPLFPYDAGQFGSGANLAFRPDVLRRLGGFAVDLGAGTVAHGGEDLDVLRRTVAAGHTVVYEPAALLWHRHRRSFQALQRQMFRYGIGLSATVTRWAVEDPRTALDILRRLPRGLVLLLAPGSDKNRRKSAAFPGQLSLLELAGVLVGPVAYLRSRRRARLRRRREAATART